MNATAAGHYRLEVCPRCDYSLAGAPPEGVCPECGRPYDSNTIVLYGNGAGRKAQVWATVPSRPLLILQGTGAIAFMLALAARRRPPLSMIMASMICLVTFAIMLWRRYSDTGPGVVQVKLGPAGFRQGVRGLGPLPYAHADQKTLIPWTRAGHVELTAVADDRVRIRIPNPRPWYTFKRDVEYVNAEVKCSADTFNLLSTLIPQWRAAARTNPAR